MKLGPVESRFASLVWDHAPLGSGELVRLCQQELNWKKPTTYTVLRKFCERGIFRNDGGIVTAVMSRDDFYASCSEEFVEETLADLCPASLPPLPSEKS